MNTYAANVLIILLILALGFYRLYLRKRWKQLRAQRVEKYNKAMLKKRKQRKAFGEIVQSYRERAQRTSVNYLKNNLLGLAALWEHDTTTAIRLLESAASAAVGKNNERGIKNNLAIGYLQARRYSDALRLLEEQRKNGYVFIIPYVFTLILNGKFDQAKSFYESNSIQDSDENRAMQTVLDYEREVPETLERIRALEQEQVLWLYESALLDCIAMWDLEVFFSRPDRYKILQEQGGGLLNALEQEPALFASPQLRWLRHVLSRVVPEVGNYQSCANLFGIIFNLETWIAKLPLSSDALNAECQLFWKRVIYTFTHTTEIRANNPQTEAEFIRSLLPVDAKPILRGLNSRCEVYASDTVGISIRTNHIYDNYGTRRYVDWLTETQTKNLVHVISPLIALIDEDTHARTVLDPLIYALVCQPDQVAPNEVQEVLHQLSENQKNALFEAGFAVNSVQSLQVGLTS